MKKHTRADRLDLFPHSVKLSNTHVRDEHVKWLNHIWPDSYTIRWTFGGPYQINFASEQDKLLFVLRWS